MLANSDTGKSSRVALALLVCACLSWNPCRALSDLRLCADPKCSAIISHGTGKVTYTAGEVGMVSFQKNARIRVLSKSAGTNPTLWGIEVTGRRGYAPKDLILENKVVISNEKLTYKVPVDLPEGARQLPILDASESNDPAAKPGPAAQSNTAPLEQTASTIVTSTESSMEAEKPQVAQIPPVEEVVVAGTKIPNIADNIPPTPTVENITSETATAENGPIPLSEVDNGGGNEIVMDPVTAESVNGSIAEETNLSKTMEEIKEENIIAHEPNSFSGNNESKETYLNETAVPNTINENTIDRTAAANSEQKESAPVKNVEISSEQHLKDELEILTNANTLEKLAENSAEKQLQSSKEEWSGENVRDNPNEQMNAELKTLQPLKGEIRAEKIATESIPIEKPMEEARSDEAVTEPKLETTTSKPISQVPVVPSYNKVPQQGDNSNQQTPPYSHNMETKRTEPQLILKTEQVPKVGEATSDYKIQANPAANVANNIETTNTNSDTKILDRHPIPDARTSEKSTQKVATEDEQTTESIPTEKPMEEVRYEAKLVAEGAFSSTANASDEAVTKPVDVSVHAVTEPGISAQLDWGADALDETTTSKPISQVPEVHRYNMVPQQGDNSNQQTPPHSHNMETKTTEPQLILKAEQEPKVVEAASDYTIQANPAANVANNIETTNSNSDTKTFDRHPIPDARTTEKSKPVATLIRQLPLEKHPMPSADKPQELYATIVNTVNKKATFEFGEETLDLPSDETLQRILYPELASNKIQEVSDAGSDQYCEKVSPNECPRALGHSSQKLLSDECDCNFDDLTLDKFVAVLSVKTLEMTDLLACLVIAAISTLLFIFGYYCFCNSSREGAFVAKLNNLERSLLVTYKENAILKEDLAKTRSKLFSIEDNSFGSNDMVKSLKQELQDEQVEKNKLQEQVGNLEKELENAAEAGLELNKIVAELLSNQSGDESIISSVEELQKQLNEQQNTIMEINANLAEKSRENSELQMMLAEQNARLGGELASLQQDNYELETEKSNLKSRLEEIKNEFEEDITKALEAKNFQIKLMQSEIIEQKEKMEQEHMKWQTSLAKIEALEDCLKSIKKDPSVNITEVINVANVRAELLDIQKQRTSLKERLDAELDAKRSIETRLEASISEVEKLKQSFIQSEKDKLEAQTRLEVLSNYFKEKETQLQKELSVKEAMWLQQQGETTSTVDRVTQMQEEVQTLKSQNDALRAEIEAQVAAHKAQTGTLENRAHETWLAARQSERRYEEARTEAAALRRRLTSLMGANVTDSNRIANLVGEGKLNDLNNAPSPIHMESPGSPLLGRLPPPPFLPPPFLGPPPPPFLGMPPPFVPPGEMRPAPLGRIMSPPPNSGPPHHKHHPHMRSGRYSPDHDDYIDYDDDDEIIEHRRGRGGGNGVWRRDSYSPPRAYCSHSPDDGRYNYTDREVMSTYDTETDFSPPPSPRDQRRNRGSRSGSYKAYSPQPIASSPIIDGNNKKTSSATKKGFPVVSSGSEKSFNSSTRQQTNKGKSMV